MLCFTWQKQANEHCIFHASMCELHICTHSTHVCHLLSPEHHFQMTLAENSPSSWRLKSNLLKWLFFHITHSCCEVGFSVERLLQLFLNNIRQISSSLRSMLGIPLLIGNLRPDSGQTRLPSMTSSWNRNNTYGCFYELCTRKTSFIV